MTASDRPSFSVCQMDDRRYGLHPVCQSLPDIGTVPGTLRPRNGHYTHSWRRSRGNRQVSAKLSLLDHPDSFRPMGTFDVSDMMSEGRGLIMNSVPRPSFVYIYFSKAHRCVGIFFFFVPLNFAVLYHVTCHQPSLNSRNTPPQAEVRLMARCNSLRPLLNCDG